MVLVFAGSNGSGKSTIKQYFEIVCEYINADDVVESTGISNMDAAELVDKLRYEAINEKKDFSFERTPKRVLLYCAAAYILKQESP